MAGTDGSGALTTWMRATFRTTAFVVALVMIEHRTGGLHDRLQSSSTLAGFAIFLIVWTTTTIATRRQRRAPIVDGDDDLESQMMSTVVAGAWNGVFLLIPLVVLAVGRLVVSAPGPGRLAPLLGLPLLVVFGAPFAFAIGGVVACAFALVEAALDGASELLVPGAGGDAQGRDGSH